MAKQRRRVPPKSLERRVGTRDPRKTLLVFCEGRLTEPEYLAALRREPVVRDVAAVDLRIAEHAGTTPLTLVRKAVEARLRATDEEAEVDEVWCVFDVEWPRNHPGLREAARRAEALAARHERNGTEFPHDNPSSGMYRLIAAVEPPREGP